MFRVRRVRVIQRNPFYSKIKNKKIKINFKIRIPYLPSPSSPLYTT